MDRLNLILYAHLNGPADPGPLTLGLARLVAEWLIWLVAIGLALDYLHSGRSGRLAIIRTGLATVLALLVNFTIAAFWYHARPFELGVGHQLLPHATDTSFPSDHATVLFSVAFGLMAFGARRLWWALALAIAVAVAWARVWLGVHWPLDMAGLLAVAAIAVFSVLRIARHRAMRKIDQVVIGLTDAVLVLLRIPPRLAPRGAESARPTAD